MQQRSHDERMRQLQQLAYGAVASDAERAAALADLAELRGEREREALRREREALRRERDAEAEPLADALELGAPAPLRTAELAAAADGSASHAARPLKWAIAAGTAALLFGVAVGWQLGTRTETLAAPTLAEQSIGLADSRFDMPVADTSVLGLFDRAPMPGDAPNSATSDDSIAPDAYRLLLTRPDGVAVHAARIDGGRNVCVTVAMPDGGTASSCTAEGRFPQQGLWVGTDVQGMGPLVATLHADASATITPPDSAMPVMPIATG